MVRNLVGWLYRKQDTDQLRNDFEGDTMTMTVVTPMTMDEATHVLTEDLIPSGFSTLNYPKGTQIKEIPKESSLRNFLFPDGKTGWVDVARVQCIVPVEEHISTPDYIIDNSDTTVTPESKSSTRELLGYCRYDVLSEDISVYRGDWIHAKVTSHDTNHWNLVSDIPVKPVRECSTLMELFGMKTGDLLYPWKIKNITMS